MISLRLEQAGFIAVGALVLIVGCLALMTGVLALSASSLWEARSFRDVMLARLLAEGGIREAGPAVAFDGGMDLWAARVVTTQALSRGHGRRVVARSLGREYALIESTGFAGPDSARAVAAAAAWRMDAVSRLGRLGRAVLGYGGVLHSSGSISGTTVRTAPEGWSADACAGDRAALDSIFSGGPVPPQLPMDFSPPDTLPGLGPLGGEALMALAPGVTGVVTPGPVVDGGTCDTDDPLNWGSPSGPDSPCGGYFPIRATHGRVTLQGGEGQGILYAAGDLEMQAGHRFVGVLLVAGDLVIGEGARVEGFIRVTGTVRVEATAVVRGSACGALRPLLSLAAGLTPIWLPDRAWLEPL